MLANIVAYFGG